MRKILVFGGTSDSRILVENLLENRFFVHLCVATECGKEVFGEKNRVLVHEGRKNSFEIEKLIEEINCDFVIDATHPYALEITENIKNASKNIKYLRLIREKSAFEYGDLVENIEEACKICKNENILLTTGSKEIMKYRSIFDKNVYARVLPTEESVNACLKAGILREKIITYLGVCTLEENLSMIRENKIQTVITKESGKVGGFLEKYNACIQEQIQLIIIKRPTDEEGYNLAEIIEILMENKYAN